MRLKKSQKNQRNFSIFYKIKKGLQKTVVFIQKK